MNLRRSTLSLAAALVLTSGCNLGRTVDKTTLKRLAPGMLAVGDVGLACAAGESLAPVMMALGHGSDGAKEPKKASALTLIAAGMCSERGAWEAELERQRIRYTIGHGGDASQASVLQDLSAKGQRFHEEAAARNYAAFLRVVDVYGAPSEEASCPRRRLKERDQQLFLLGMTAGLLATIHDTQADRVVGVPQSIPPLVQDGVACLDDERWWGVPGALGAAIAASIPGAAAPGVDPWVTLESAAQRGEAQGLWLGRALQLQAAVGAGKDDVVWSTIAAHGAALSRSAAAGDGGAGAADGDYALLNAYASEMIRFASDVRWLEATGQRTPLGQLGQRPPAREASPPPVVSDAEAAEFLDGIEDEPDQGAPSGSDTATAGAVESTPGDPGPNPSGGSAAAKAAAPAPQPTNSK
ncbi:MAG: hypothetical protein R3A79_02080 [Nannocystaceae bacterium]